MQGLCFESGVITSFVECVVKYSNLAGSEKGGTKLKSGWSSTIVERLEFEI